MANKLITLRELAQEIIATAEREGAERGLTKEQVFELAAAVCASIGGMPMEMGGVRAPSEPLKEDVAE